MTLHEDMLLIDKPVGWTSFDVVAKIRGKIRARYTARGEKPTKRQLRVGHTGTLDPFATGLLIILLGDECKRSDEFMKKDKVYEATIRLGQVSTTGDPEGEISDFYSFQQQPRDKDVQGATFNRDPESMPQGRTLRLTEVEEVAETLKKFVGEIEQTPPMFSAIKIGGQRAYKLARKGEVVEMPKRTVTIYSLELLDYSYPELKIRTHVSSGTYIRSLAIDIGETLGTGAYCSELRRTRIADWDVADATREFDVTFMN